MSRSAFLNWRIPICCSTRNRPTSMCRAPMSNCVSTFRKTARGSSCNVSQRLLPCRRSQRIDIVAVNFRRTFLTVLFQALFFSSLAFGKEKDDAEFVDIKSVDGTILVDLRYAGTNNVAHRPLYPPGTPALVRRSVAQRLHIAQDYLRQKGYGF